MIRKGKYGMICSLDTLVLKMRNRTWSDGFIMTYRVWLKTVNMARQRGLFRC